MSFPDRAYTARAAAIVERAVEQAFPLYGELRRHLLGILREASGFDQASHFVKQQGADSAFIKENAELLFDSMATMEATGRSFLVEKDRFYSERGRRASGTFELAGIRADYLDVGWISCGDGTVRISFDLIPEEAVEYLRRKALTIAAVENDELLKALQAKLIDAAQTGKTFAEFRAEANSVFASFGVEPIAPYRLQTVFRTNLFSAYSIGQLEQMSQMRESFPLWRYVAILDSATRPEHRALSGKIFRAGEGPYPPIDYNCRCSAQHIHYLEARQRGLAPSPDPPLPPGVRRFDIRSEFERWAAGRVTDMNPAVKEVLSRGS